MRQMGIRHRNELCGFYAGVPLTQRSREQAKILPDVVTIYREGILAAAADRVPISPKSLKAEIRKTVLHGSPITMGSTKMSCPTWGMSSITLDGLKTLSYFKNARHPSMRR